MRTTAILILAILGIGAYTAPKAMTFDEASIEVWHANHTRCVEQIRDGKLTELAGATMQGPVYLYCMKHLYGQDGERLEAEIRKDEVKM